MVWGNFLVNLSFVVLIEFYFCRMVNNSRVLFRVVSYILSSFLNLVKFIRESIIIYKKILWGFLSIWSFRVIWKIYIYSELRDR